MAKTRIASVVVTYRRINHLRNALRAILDQTRPPDLVYVVDNASGDGTEAMLRSEFPHVTHLEMEDNVGVGAAFAAGISEALEGGAEGVWLHDDDSIPAPRALERSLVVLERDPGLGVVGNIGGAFRWGLPTSYRGPRVVIQGASMFPADFVELDGALISAEAIRRMGLPRSDFFMMWEGYEYSNRIARAGFRVVCFDEDLIYRGALGAGGANPPPWRAYYQTRNHLVWALEQGSKRELIGWGYRQLRFVIGTLLYLDRKVQRLRMRGLGAWHGLRRVMGRTIEPTAP